MHSTGYIAEDKRSFSEKNWNHRTAIYLKLVKNLSDSQWNKFSEALRFAEGMEERIKEISRPVEHWTDDPEEYFIVGSDPATEAE